MSKPTILDLFVASEDERNLGDYLRGPVKPSLVRAVRPPLEINGEPANDVSHEHVIRKKPRPNAQN